MIPVIDLNCDFASRTVEGRKMIEACEGVGCFRVMNHGVSIELMAEMKSLVADLLDLPAEIKRNNKDVIPGSGYMAPTPTNPHYEALGLFDVGSSQAVDEFCSQLQLSPLQRSTIEKYAEAIYNVTVDVANKLAKSMGLEDDHLFKGWACQFRINRYNYSPETVGSLGVQMHTDSGFLTVLQDDENVGGLEVKDQSGKFIAVDPLPGTLVVNLGDVGAAWSNGRLCNVQHRVQCWEATKRYSIATFLSPQREMVIEPPQEFVDADHPRLYSSVTYEELRRLRSLNNLHCGEILNLVRRET
ncbi:hypothetical protein V2J09_002028 [Rumex salicifolius]